MSYEMSPLSALLEWLPSELEYIAKKHPYAELVEDSRKAINDPQGIYVRLGSEWHIYQMMRQLGNHHADGQLKTAQLQLAKFAAGLLTHASVSHWLQSGELATEEAFTAYSEETAIAVTDFWLDHEMSSMGLLLATPELARPFQETHFSKGIKAIMHQTVLVADETNPSRRSEQCDELFDEAFSLGNWALHCYVAYAQSDLTSEQYNLPPSQLAA